MANYFDRNFRNPNLEIRTFNYRPGARPQDTFRTEMKPRPSFGRRLRMPRRLFNPLRIVRGRPNLGLILDLLEVVPSINKTVVGPWFLTGYRLERGHGSPVQPCAYPPTIGPGSYASFCVTWADTSTLNTWNPASLAAKPKRFRLGHSKANPAFPVSSIHPYEVAEVQEWVRTTNNLAQVVVTYHPAIHSPWYSIPMRWFPDPNIERQTMVQTSPAVPMPELSPVQLMEPEIAPHWRYSSVPPGRPLEPHVREPPPRNEKQEKYNSPLKRVGQIIREALDYTSEAAEVVSAVYDALPVDVRRRWERGRNTDRGPVDQFGQYGIDGADWKLPALYHNWHRVDFEQAVRNIIKNAIEDKLIGQMHQMNPPILGQTSKEWHRLQSKTAKYISDTVDQLIDSADTPEALDKLLQELLGQ